MAGIKLAKLPDRAPVKLTLSLSPELHQRMVDYARAYAEAYQVEEHVSELAPAMIAAFLDGDREFTRRKR